MAILDTTVVNGNLNVIGSVYAQHIYTVSDARLKENIKDLNLDCSEVLNKLELKEYNYISDPQGIKTIGVIAQELEAALPDEYKESFIAGRESDMYLVNANALIFLAIGTIQKQQKQIDDLKDRIKELEEK